MAKIQCTYSLVTERHPVYRSYYQCIVDSKTIPSTNFCLEGEHEETRSNENVQKLLIVDCIFTEFPKDFQDIFPMLTNLYIENCVFNKVGREHIGKWTKLTVITINDCHLKYLQGDTFRDLSRVKSINLKKNLLEEIDPDIFDGLTNLQSVNLYGNKNISTNARDPSQIEQLKEEIKLNCKPKNKNYSPLYFTNKITELEQEIHNLKVEQLKNGQVVKEAKTLKKQLTIMTDPAFKDFTININDSSFKIHKLIFAARSKILAELLRNNPEATELNLRDIPEATFETVHDFIYTNQLPEDDTNYLEVFAAASRLKIDDLVEITANQLLKTLDENNSIEILELSNKFNHEQLKQKSFENIRTKIFPDRKIDDNLAKNTEKLKKLIKMKKMIDEEFQK